MPRRTYGAFEEEHEEVIPERDEGCCKKLQTSFSRCYYIPCLALATSLFMLCSIATGQPESHKVHLPTLNKAWTPFSLPAIPKNNFTILNPNSHKAVPQSDCLPPYPGYPQCEEKVNWLKSIWNSTSWQEKFYRSAGVDGTPCSFINYLNQNGLYCPLDVDARKEKIRGVNIGGWLVLEPWITPSLFAQFDPADNVEDQWSFCAKLGKEEAQRQLEKHWDTWFTEQDMITLAQSGINHIRIPVGYWIMGDIQPDEPLVNGGLKYLKRAVGWAKDNGVFILIDLHCAPGSQNGFDNSGRKGAIDWPKKVTYPNGTVSYPNIERTLRVIKELTEVLTEHPFEGTVVAFELVNEAFITIDINVVKQFYLDGYSVVRSIADLAIVIGDSFRFGQWNGFMFPPLYNHVWIDTHIYHVFDMWRLSLTWQDHINLTCTRSLPEVAVAPLSVMVGEWSLAITDCAKWLNGYGTGARFDGTFPGSWPLGSCVNESDPSTYDQYQRSFLRLFAEVQMNAYESGSSAGWFFWNFKTESAPPWDYLLGLKEGWIPNQNERKYTCADPEVQRFSSDSRAWPLPPY